MPNATGAALVRLLTPLQRSTLVTDALKLITAAITLALFGFGVAAAASDDALDFANEVRPLLSDRCFGCHGPGHQESGLRIDTFDGATEWAIEPGDAESSEVIARVETSDEDLRMPPADSDMEPLSEEEIALLRRWIDSGAEYEAHWAFAPLEKPAEPETTASESPIDGYLSERLEEEGLEWLPEADRHTLIRRVGFDLTGLPPTPEQVSEFLADTAPGAYERLVDRLLDSPRYGEHMARFWLDAVRYADTHGKHYDNYREIWPYRDWVVRSFNANKAYDEFLTEQLAGDLLPNPSRDQLIATGFNRCNMTTNEGGTIEKEVYTDNVRDRTDAFGTVVLGLTVACAKCHDHKYDPIKQKDYYSLFAFFNSLDGGSKDLNRKDHAPAMRVSTPEHDSKVAILEQAAKDRRADLYADNPAIDATQPAWEQTLSGLSDPAIRGGILSGPLVEASDWLFAGPFKAHVRWQIEKGTSPPEKGAFKRDQTWKKSDQTDFGWVRHGEWIDGQSHQLVMGRMSAGVLYRTLTVEEPTEIEVALHSDDMVRVHLNGEVQHTRTEPRKASDVPERVKLKLEPGENALMVRIGNYEKGSEFNFQFLGATVLPAEAMTIVRTPADDRTDEQRADLRRTFREKHGSPETREHRKRLFDAEMAAFLAQEATPTTLVFREREKPRDAFVLNRGDYDNEGEKVERATPGFLPPFPEGATRDRLGLARWATSPENPLPARVAVNRFWQQIFGVGLVKTADDFGSQAEPPSHPELLDWLAYEFVESGWDIRAMMKRLVMTRAYRQQSAAPAELWERDPENRLLARGPRFRLDGETLRDQALSLSGLLVNRMGGPPVRPPQPSGLWKAVAYQGSDTRVFVADKTHDKVHRRSLYTFHKRTSGPPQMLVFDGPTRESCTVRRERTNTPLQALLLMNDPQYVEAARALAQRVLSEAPESPESQAAWLIELTTSRPAKAVEIDELVRAVAEERERYESEPAAAEGLVSVGIAPSADTLDKAELAAWTVAANLVLNLDEVVSKN